MTERIRCLRSGSFFDGRGLGGRRGKRRRGAAKGKASEHEVPCRASVGGTYVIVDPLGACCGTEPAPSVHPFRQDSGDGAENCLLFVYIRDGIIVTEPKGGSV